MTVTVTLRRGRQENHKFKTSLGSIVRPSLKKRKKDRKLCFSVRPEALQARTPLWMDHQNERSTRQPFWFSILTHSSLSCIFIFFVYV
jgi:hypothetical protein